jgi:hypothetical protein
MNEMTNKNVQTWECGAENATDVIATLDKHTLTISGKGEMRGYIYYGANAGIVRGMEEGISSCCDDDQVYVSTAPWCPHDISNVVIEQGVTSIGDCAFKDCTILNTIVIPTSVVHIGAGAFANCAKLTSITIPDGVTSIGAGAFVNCARLTSVTIPKSVTCIEWWLAAPGAEAGIRYDAFGGCSQLTAITNLKLRPQDNVKFDDEILKNTTLFVHPSVIDVYKNIPVWRNFNKIEAIETDKDSPEQIKKQISAINEKIEKLEKERDELHLKQALMRGLKGNPKHVAEFMALFNQRDGLKYLTHDFDESGEFDMETFLAQARKICTENFEKLELPQTLKALLNQFVFESKPEWGTFDAAFNPKEIKSGWSAAEWQEVKGSKLHPIKDPQFAEIIKDFKRTTRIESPNLEKIIDKVFADETFKLEKEDLSKADFYTHVGEFKTALETIFEEIQKHGDSPDKKKVSVEYKKETCCDYFVRKIIITHHNSFPTRNDEDALIKEWLSLDKGNMGKIAEHLQGYCHWSVETCINENPVRVNILREKETPTHEAIDISEVKGFTHILTFYYQS